jgi:hypothetical protein
VLKTADRRTSLTPSSCTQAGTHALVMQVLLRVRVFACACALAQVFEAAPQEARGAQSKRAAPDYFL